MSDKDRSGFERHLEKKNDLYFVEHWKDHEKPLSWFSHWERLSVVLSVVKVYTVFHYAERKRGQERTADPLQLYDRDEFEKIALEQGETEDEAARIAKVRDELLNRTFWKPDAGDGVVFEFKFETTGKRSVNFIEDGGTPDIYKTSGEFTLYGSQLPKGGYLSLTNDDDAKWSEGVEAGTVSIQTYISNAEAKEFLAVLRAASPNAEVRADLDVLAFQSEMERSLAEPYHHQTYSFEKGEFSPVVLKSLMVIEPAGSPQSAEQERSGKVATSIHVEPPARPLAAPSTFPVSATLALWAIAIAVIALALS
jgi:hypothetical protein